MSLSAMPYSRNVYIASLPSDYTDAQLLALFTPYGQVLSHSVKTDKATGKCKGYGFVLYAREEDACNAVIALQGHYINHTKVQVRLARPEASAKRVYPVLAQQHDLQSRLYGGAAQQGYGSTPQSTSRSSDSAAMSSTSSISGDASAPSAVDEECRTAPAAATAAAAPTTTVDAATYQALLQLLAYYSSNTASANAQVDASAAAVPVDFGIGCGSALGQTDVSSQSPACGTDTTAQYDSYYYYMYLAQLQQQQLMHQQQQQLVQ